MERRVFISFLAAMGNEPSLGCQVKAEDPIDKGSERVIIIGAGMAGLAAARELRRHGREVIILEARDRIGGRLWTSQKWQDAPVDLGASWIHGVKGNPLTRLADEANAERIETSYQRSITYDTGGQPLDAGQEEDLERLRKKLRLALRTAQDADDDVSIYTVASSLAREMNADEETKRMLNFLISSEIEQEYAGSAKQLSAHWYDNVQTFGGPDVLLAKGYEVLVQFLSHGLSIQLGEVVQRLDWSSDIVSIFTGQREWKARKVILTLPLGVLKKGFVQFTPELPRPKFDAISKLEMGHLNKCYLRFPSVFWPKDVDWIEHIPREHGVWTEWVSLARGTGLPILLGFNAGDRGRQIEAWSDQQIVENGMQTLRTIFGSHIPAPTDHQITRWSSDPYSLGAYSLNPVGSQPDMRKRMAQSVGQKLYFAGEACEANHFGTAHGAYLSGIRAAREVLS